MNIISSTILVRIDKIYSDYEKKEKGWLNPEAKYYVDVPVNPVYDAIGWISEKMLRKKTRKELAEA